MAESDLKSFGDDNGSGGMGLGVWGCILCARKLPLSHSFGNLTLKLLKLIFIISSVGLPMLCFSINRECL